MFIKKENRRDTRSAAEVLQQPTSVLCLSHSADPDAIAAPLVTLPARARGRFYPLLRQRKKALACAEPGVG